MSDVSGSAPRRPASARPRQEVEAEATMAPPSPAEQDAIEYQHATMPDLTGAQVVEDTELGVIWIRYPHRVPAVSFAKYIRWPADEVESRLATLAGRMRANGDWPAISVAETVAIPGDLADRLSAAGWIRVGGERIMFTRHAPVVPHLDPGLRVEAVTPASALECVRLEVANFGDSPVEIGERAERLAVAVASGAARGYIVRLLREPVASTRLIPGDRIAAVTAVGVAAGQRGRGYGRLVVAVATRAGLATGHGLVWLSVDENNTAAVKLYGSLGYKPSFAWSRWAAPAD